MNLFAHQADGCGRLSANPLYMVNGEPGVGKTIMALAAIAANPVRTLVLAPKSVMRTAWLGDAVHFPSLDVCAYHGPARQKSKWRDAGVVVTTYDTFKNDAIELSKSGFKRFVIDESSKVRNPKSTTSKYAVRFSELVDICWPLSGTPDPNGPQNWWAQLACIKHTGGMGYWKWLDRYAYPAVKIMVRGREIAKEWKLRDKEAFASMLSAKVWSLRKQDCLTLPPQTDVMREVELSPDEAKAYDACEKELRLTKNNGVEASIKSEAVLTKIRQIVGGGVRVDGVAQDVGDSKLTELEAVLDEIGDQPVVLWAWYRHEIDRISDMCNRTGRHGAILDGRTSGNAEWIVRNFQEGNIRCLVCHPQACGHGITLTAACHSIWYGLSFDLELYEQAKNRVHRIGQNRNVTHWHLVAAGTIDEAMLKSLRSKSKASEGIKAYLAALSDPASR